MSRHAGSARSAPTAPAPAPGSGSGTYPLTAGQRAIWFSQQYLGDDGALYAAAEQIEIRGRLRPAHWVAAVRAATAQTDALRTRIVGDDTDPRQVLEAPGVGPTPQVVDLRGAPDPERAARDWVAEALATPIDVRRGVVGQTALLRLADDRSRWVHRVHHLALDGYGFALVARRVAAHVRTLAGGGEGAAGVGAGDAPDPGTIDALVRRLGPLVPDGAVAEEVAADADYDGSPAQHDDRRHWLGLLGDLDAVPGLTEGEIAPSGDVHRAALVLGPDRVAALTAAGRRSDAGWPEAFGAACAALLHGLTGSRDVVIGLPVMGRIDGGALARPSNAQNIVPVRVRVAPEDRVDDVVGRVAAAIRDGRPHARYRHERLRRELGLLAGDGRFAGLFLNLKPFVQTLRLGPGADGAPVVGTVRALWEGPVEDLSLSVWSTAGGGLEVAVEAPGTAYDEPGVQAHRDRLDALLHAVAAAGTSVSARRDARGGSTPDASGDDGGALTVADLPIATPAELRRVRAFGAGPAMPEPADTLVDRLHVRLTGDPQAPALRGPDLALTAGELDARTATLARALRARGVGRETVVAIAQERGAAYVASMLAVLRAGAAFLPLDPGLPAERLAFLLEDSGAVAVLADEHGRERLPPSDLPFVDPHGAPGEGPDVTDGPRPRDAAYVIYTSGTTGTPKGVVVEHRTAINLLDGHAALLYGPTAERVGRRRARFVHSHSFSFDSGISPLLALIAGHELVVASADVVLDPAALAGLVRDEEIDYLDVTPAMFEALVAEGVLDEGRHVPALVALGGEAAPPELWRRLRTHPTTVGWNTYGPTECTVDAVVCPVADHDAPVIGRPIAGSRAYVLDEARRPVPPGVAGELVVGGRNVARGYLGRPDLTDERFPRDPWAPADERAPDGTPPRMYATGDLVRWTPDGLLEFLGRADDQVKLRGFRIELGEVAAALTSQPEVGQAVAVVREDRPGDRRLVAYVTPARPAASGSPAVQGRASSPAPMPASPASACAAPDPRSLIVAVARTLPHYAVPSAVVVLDALPMTVSRKIDRRALPAPDPVAPTGADRPGTALERLVCAVCADVLGLPAVGLHDDVFAVGAHSLLVARIAARLRELLGADVGVRTVFDHPTPALLVAAIGADVGRAAHAAADAATGAARLVPPPRPEVLPLAPSQRRLWFLQRLQGPSATYDVPVVLRLRGAVDVDALDAALADVVARHETLRTRYPERDGAPEQQIVAPGDAAVPLTVEALPAGALERRVAALARHVFDVTTDLPLRATLLSPEGGPATAEHVLVLVLHHIAADGWSLGPLIADLSRAYAARRTAPDGPSALPPVAVQHADHAVALEARAGADEAALDAWEEALRGAPEALELPGVAEDAGPTLDHERGGEVRETIPADVHARLVALAREQGATTFMAVHALVAALLTRSGVGTDVPLGTVTLGRDAPGLDETVGFFANTVVLRTDTDGDPDLPTLLRRVRATDLAAFERGGVPFDRVVERLRPPRAEGRTPLFNVMVVFQNTPATAWADGGPTGGTRPDVADGGALRADVGGGAAGGGRGDGTSGADVGDGAADGDVGALQVEVAVHGNGTAKFDLTFELTERFDVGGAPAGLDLRVEHRRSRVDAATAAGLARRLVRLAERWSADPADRLWEPSIDAVDDLVPVAAPEPPVAAPADGTTLVSWFDDACHVHAARVALTGPVGADAAAGADGEPPAHGRSAADGRSAAGGTASLTYAALDARVNRLARVLLARGARRGTLVALALPRTSDLVVALLAILRTGAGYLPLDPAYPAERLRATVRDAAPVLAVTAADVDPDALAGVPVVALDEPGVRTALGDPGAPGRRAPLAAGPLTDAERAPARPDDVAYVIYTSGSTGRPKGVEVTHHNVVRLFTATDGWFGFGPDDVWTLFHSTAFDFSVWELWGALLHGGRLVVVPHEVSRSPDAFLRLLVDEGATVLNQTPSAFWSLVAADRDDPQLGDRLALRAVVFGGEALEPAKLRPWFARHPDDAPRLVNMYGITETTVHVTHRPIAEADVDRPGPSPIGVPIPDLRIHVLDAGGHPVPPHTTGEMFVAGGGVARGYLGRPELTAERFVDHPEHGRLYRTGDLARIRPDGTLDYLGRADGQVKVRGFRIEPGEIEAVLRDVPGVRDAVVIVREDRPGDRRLVGYVVGVGGAAPAAAVRAAAARTLPAHMVPSAVVVVDALPLTPNGKLDVRALPAPDPGAASGGRAPEGVAEERLCRLFADALGLERVGADDSFFELGGHSLLAVRLLRDVSDAFGAPVGIGALFSAPTPAGLARVLDDGDQPSPLEVLLPLRGPLDAPGRPRREDAATAPGAGRGDGPAPVFCVHPAGGLSWCYSGLARRLPADRPIVGVQARGIARPEPLPASLGVMADDYVAQIRAVRPHGPYHLLGWSLGGMVVHAMAARLQAMGEEVGLVALLDAYPSDGLRRLQPPDEAEALSALLAMGGYDESVLRGREISVEVVVDALREEGSAMASLTPGTLMAIKDTYVNTATILREYEHEVLDHDVLFLRATVGIIDGDQTPDTWSPFLRGALDVHDVACTHREMCQPEPLAEIGRVVADRLAAWEAARPAARDDADGPA